MPRNARVDDDDEEWSEGTELALLAWAEKAAGLRWLHLEAGKLERLLNDAVSVPVVILSTLAGLGSITDNNCGKPWINIAFTVINLLNATLVSLQRYLEPGQKASTHTAIAADYSKLYRSIAQELALPPRRRERCIEFTTATRTEYDRLVSSSLEVPSCVVRRFKKRFAAADQAQPEIVSGGLERIPQRAPTQNRDQHQVVSAVLEEGTVEAAALGGAVTPGPGRPPVGQRRMRRASTVIQDVLANPAVGMQIYRSQRLPELPATLPATDLEAMQERVRSFGDLGDDTIV